MAGSPACWWSRASPPAGAGGTRRRRRPSRRRARGRRDAQEDVRLPGQDAAGDSRVTVSPSPHASATPRWSCPAGAGPPGSPCGSRTGAQPVPRRVGAVHAVSRTGARSSGSSLTPLRRLEPGRRRSARMAIITFLVPKDFVPAQVRMASIVDRVAVQGAMGGEEGAASFGHSPFGPPMACSLAPGRQLCGQRRRVHVDIRVQSRLPMSAGPPRPVTRRRFSRPQRRPASPPERSPARPAC